MTADALSPDFSRQGQHVAFASDTTSVAKLADTLVAFANAGGGTLLMGLEPRSGNPTGVEDPEDAVDRALKAALATDPPLIIPMPQVTEREGRPVISITVPPGLPNVYSFRGKYLMVNADADEGQLRAEILDPAGQLIRPFTRANSLPIGQDKTLIRMNWRGVDDLSALAGKPVCLRFHLRKGSLYSFWVAADRSGASQGYVAAGGPGLTGPIDTVGIKAYATAERR